MTMQATELRLGNYFYSNIIQQVDVEHFEWLLDLGFEMHGILLSPQWLLDLGFEMHGKNYQIKTGWYYTSYNQKQKQTSLNIRHTSADNYLVLSPGNGSIYIKTVHQLQNLYFALTGGAELFLQKDRSKVVGFNMK
jgi:hypothetical protein